MLVERFPCEESDSLFQTIFGILTIFSILLALVFAAGVVVAVIFYSVNPLFEKIARSSVTQTGAALAGLMVLIGFLYGVCRY